MIFTHCPLSLRQNQLIGTQKSPGSLTYKGNPKYFPDMVNYMDHLVGHIVKKVEEQGLLEKTLIIFTGDNGTDKPIVSMMNGKEVKAGKGTMKDSGTRVPLIVYSPNLVKTKVHNDLVDFR